MAKQHVKHPVLLLGPWIPVLFFIFFSTCGAIMSKERSLDREKIPAQYQWNLSDIYPNWTEWESGMTEMEKKIQAIKEFKGTLNKGPSQLLQVLKMDDDMGILFQRVYRYPQYMRDTDMRNQDNAARFQRAESLVSNYRLAVSWIHPEILAIGKDRIQQWLKSTPGLTPYRFMLEDLYRKESHILDEPREELLAYFNRFQDSPASIYMDLTTADIRFPKVTLSDGREVLMSGPNYSRELNVNRNRQDRRKAFEKHYRVYKVNENTFASIYRAVCFRDRAISRSRGYHSALEYYLEEDNIPVTVYENLVKSVRANTGPLKRYHQLRAGILNLDEYRHFDTSIPLTENTENYSFDNAREKITAAIFPLGNDYSKRVKAAFTGGWIDVYENTGKRAGAYSSNVYGVHPYILLNYNDTLPYVLTVSHEVGHAIHSQLACENQPYANHSYTIFVAEVSSTLNERLLVDYLLQHSKNRDERIAILEQSIRRQEETFYFQTLLADFELQAHRLVEQDKPLTAKVLNRIMQELYQDYYGESITHDRLVNIVWTRVHHLYRSPYYIFQYATAFAASAQLHQMITQGPANQRQTALAKYLELLASGGSDYPISQLKRAGVDLTQPDAFNAVFSHMNQLVSQLEKELQETNE